MTSQAVLDRNTISLNGTLYPLKRPVQRHLASIYPGKVVVGDTGRDSNPNASPLARSDWSGGIGLFKDEGVSPQPRSFFSTCSLRYKSLTLPGLEVETAASGATGTFTVGVIGELDDEIYAAFGSSVRKYDFGADSWGSSLHTLPEVATDVLSNVRMGGTVYLIFAHTGGYTYFDGTTWTNDSKDAKYLAFWADKLYGIDKTGLLWNASTIGTETNDAQLPLPDDTVTALFQARDAAGTVILYAATKVGLFAHDNTNTKWVATEVDFPVHPDGGRGTVKWRDSVHTPAGLGIYKFINGANSAVLTIEGPDRDDGMPSGKGGTIVQLVNSHNDLLAVNDATVGYDHRTKLTTFVSRGMRKHRGVTMNPNEGFSSILGLNDMGWEVKFLSASTDKAISYAMVSSAYGKYLLWFGMGERVSYIEVPSEIVNPNEISTLPYAASAQDISPWYNIGQMEVNKLGLQLRVETLDLSSTETVKVSIAYDLVDTDTVLGTITTNGVTTYVLPDTTTPAGKTFLWFRITIDLARGTTTTKTPQMVNWTMEYRKKLPEKWGFGVALDLTKDDYHGKTPADLRADIVTAVGSEVLLPFLWRDDASGVSTFYVDVAQADGLEYTGHDQRGDVNLVLVER